MSNPLVDVWIPAARPKTLAAALAPVVMGCAIAYGDGVFELLPAIAALIGAMAIQIGTNFANDFFDHLKGADTDERIGPTRATATGQVDPEAMRRAFQIAFLVAILAGSYLVWVAGWPVVVIGLLSIAFGVMYTGGPMPLAYMGIADIFVLIFFGPVAVAGTYYVQGLEWSAQAIVSGLAPGMLSVALLTVNNLRDIDQDRKAHKRTLAVRFGRTFAKLEYVICVLVPAWLPVILVSYLDAPQGVLAASAAALIGIPPLREVIRARPRAKLDSALAGTGRLLVVYAIAFSLGWVLSA